MKTARALAQKFRSWLRDQVTDPGLPLPWSRARVVVFWAFVGAVVCVSIPALIYLPRWQVDEVVGITLRRDQVKAFELENEARKTLTQIVLGAFGLIVLFLTWQRVRANDRNVLVIEQGHITDRYTKAIEQLGKLEDLKPNIEVRLGGIYALERLAFDSPRDHWTIMEVLSAYVRRNARWVPADNQTDDTARAQEGSPRTSPRTDIEAILTVFGRRRLVRKLERDQLNLMWCDLRGANLYRAHLEGANLNWSHLEGANFHDAHLEGVWLWGAHLEGAYLAEAHLEYAHLAGAHLDGASLRGAHLEGAFLGEQPTERGGSLQAKLERADLQEAHLEKADFTGARLEGANLQGAHLEFARLMGAHLEGADLRRAHLGGALLWAAHLEGADLGDAHMGDADLHGAHLEGANGITVEQVRSANRWENAHYDPAFATKLGLEGQELQEAADGSA